MFKKKQSFIQEMFKKCFKKIKYNKPARRLAGLSSLVIGALNVLNYHSILLRHPILLRP